MRASKMSSIFGKVESPYDANNKYISNMRDEKKWDGPAQKLEYSSFPK